MSIKNIIAAAACLFAGFAAPAQQQQANPQTNPFGYIPQTRLSLSANGLVDPRPFLEAGIEYRTGVRSSAEASLGFLLPYAPLTFEVGTRERDGFQQDQTFDNLNTGVRFRFNYKRYDKMLWRSAHANNYWGPEFMFNYNTLESSGWYDRFQGAYDQYMAFKRKQMVLGLGIKAGEQIFLLRSKSLYLDYYTGIGIRAIFISTPGMPDDVVLMNGMAVPGYGVRGPGTYCMPYITAGLKIGLVLKH